MSRIAVIEELEQDPEWWLKNTNMNTTEWKIKLGQYNRTGKIIRIGSELTMNILEPITKMPSSDPKINLEDWTTEANRSFVSNFSQSSVDSGEINYDEDMKAVVMLVGNFKEFSNRKLFKSQEYTTKFWGMNTS